MSANDKLEGAATEELLAELDRRGVGAQVAIGPPMSPEEEAAHKRRLAAQSADQAEAEVQVMQAKLDGIKESLAAKKAEAKELRAEAKRLEREGGEG